MTIDEKALEGIAEAMWAAYNPPEAEYSRAAPRDWSKWPDTPPDASLVGEDFSREDYRLLARAAITAYEAAKAPVREGWVMVPKEPTPEMYIKGGIAISDAKPDAETYADEATACWDAMLSASPSPGE